MVTPKGVYAMKKPKHPIIIKIDRVLAAKILYNIQTSQKPPVLVYVTFMNKSEIDKEMLEKIETLYKEVGWARIEFRIRKKLFHAVFYRI